MVDVPASSRFLPDRTTSLSVRGLQHESSASVVMELHPAEVSMRRALNHDGDHQVLDREKETWTVQV